LGSGLRRVCGFSSRWLASCRVTAAACRRWTKSCGPSEALPRRRVRLTALSTRGEDCVCMCLCQRWFSPGLNLGLGQSLLCTEPWPTARAFPFTFNQGSRLCTKPGPVLQPSTRDLGSVLNQGLFCTKPGPVLQPSTSKLGLGSVARSKLRSVASLPRLRLPRSLAPSLTRTTAKSARTNGNLCDPGHTYPDLGRCQKKSWMISRYGLSTGQPIAGGEIQRRPRAGCWSSPEPVLAWPTPGLPQSLGAGGARPPGAVLGLPCAWPSLRFRRRDSAADAVAPGLLRPLHSCRRRQS